MPLRLVKEPVRIQIAIYNILVAEVIVADFATADQTWAAWCVRRYKLHKEMGGACIQNASKSRLWNVAVGTEIN